MKGSRQLQVKRTLSFASAATAYYEVEDFVLGEPVNFDGRPSSATLIPGTARFPDDWSQSLDACVALCTAQALAVQVDSQPKQRWPVLWDEEQSMVLILRADGHPQVP